MWHLRIRREIFNVGEFEHHYEDAPMTREELCAKYRLDVDTTTFYGEDGLEIEGDTICGDTVTAIVTPAIVTSVTTAIIVAAVAIAAIAVGTAIIVAKMDKIANQKTTTATYSYSVRGSNNQLRSNQGVGIVLGSCNVCGDIAGQPYSSYDESLHDNVTYGEDQYLHQIVCTGYAPKTNAACTAFTEAGVIVESHTDFQKADVNPNGYKIHIGDSPIDAYKDVNVYAKQYGASYPTNWPYTKRMSEEAVTQELEKKLNNQESDVSITRTSPTNTIAIGVGIYAPYGYYKSNNEGGRDAILLHYRVRYKVKGTNVWTVAEEPSVSIGVPYYRHVVSITCPSTGQYDVEIVNYGDGVDHSNESAYCETLACEFIQYQTQGSVGTTLDEKKAPIRQPELFTFVSFKIKATDQLNGYVDTLYAKCHLICRTYVGDYTETFNFEDYWQYPTVSNAMAIGAAVGTMNNPASVLLYVLTDPRVNPRPIPDDKIDWISLREWFRFCSTSGRNWSCNAFVTDKITVAELAQNVCSTGRATLVRQNGVYSVRISKAQSNVAQMFTPRNASNMTESISYEDKINLIKAEFVNQDTETQETCYIYYNDDETTESGEIVIHCASELLNEDAYNGTTISAWGVTNAKQVFQLMKYNLSVYARLNRTYTWECGFESINCAVGDVVYLANDLFTFSLGYGRITSLDISGSTITGIYIDESVGIDTTASYGITVRLNDGTFQTIPVNQHSSDSHHLIFTTPISSSIDVKSGNLFIYGTEGKKVIITEISNSTDRTATITATDYYPALYDVDITETIPAYESSVSQYSSGAQMNKGRVRYDGTTPSIVGPAGANGSIPLVQYALGTSSSDYPSGGSAQELGVSSTNFFGIDTDAIFSIIGWSDIVPSVVPSGYYIWMRVSRDDGVTWQYSRLTGEQGAQGEDGEDGEPAYMLKVFASQGTFYTNRRIASEYNRIEISVKVSGYTVTPTLSVVYPSGLTIDNGILNIPYNLAYSFVQVKASLTEDNVTVEDVLTLSAVDETELNAFLGVYTEALPESYKGTTILTSDYFAVGYNTDMAVDPTTNRSYFTVNNVKYYTGSVYTYTGTSYVEKASDEISSSEALTCLKAFADGNVDLDKISNNNYVTWMKTIVTDKVITNEIFAQLAEFENLVVNRKADFKGTITSTPLKTTQDTGTAQTYTASNSQLCDGFLWEEVRAYINDNLASSLTSGIIYSASGVIDGSYNVANVIKFTSLSENYKLFSDTYYSAATTVTASFVAPTSMVMSYDCLKLSAFRNAFFRQYYSTGSLIVQYILNGTTTTVFSSAGEVYNGSYPARAYQGNFVIPAGAQVSVSLGTPLDGTINANSGYVNVYFEPVNYFQKGVNLCLANNAGIISLDTKTGVGTSIDALRVNNVDWMTLTSSSWTVNAINKLYLFGNVTASTATHHSNKINSTTSINITLSDGTQITADPYWVEWSSSGLVIVIDNRTYQFVIGTTYLRSFSISIATLGESPEMKTWNILPQIRSDMSSEESSSIQGDPPFFNLGSSDRIWNTLFVKALGTSLQKITEAYINTINSNTISATSIEADTLEGDLTGDVNTAGTSNKVYGAVWN